MAVKLILTQIMKNESHIAERMLDSIKDIVPKHYDVILDCLKTHGALGKDGIAALTNLENMQVARRLHELQRMNLIELTGKTVKSNSGRNEREWQCHTQT